MEMQQNVEMEKAKRRHASMTDDQLKNSQNVTEIEADEVYWVMFWDENCDCIVVMFDFLDIENLFFSANVCWRKCSGVKDVRHQIQIWINAWLDIRSQVEVKDQNMAKHPLGIYHGISTLYADLMMNSVMLSMFYGKFPRDACPCFDP